MWEDCGRGIEGEERRVCVVVVEGKIVSKSCQSVTAACFLAHPASGAIEAAFRISANHMSLIPDPFLPTLQVTHTQ